MSIQICRLVFNTRLTSLTLRLSPICANMINGKACMVHCALHSPAAFSGVTNGEFHNFEHLNENIDPGTQLPYNPLTR